MINNKNNAVALVIEDEIPLAEAVQMKMVKEGFKVIGARTVSQALEILEELTIVDVIWLDHYLLGKENGLDFIVKIKNEERWKKIPVFVVSNTASPDKVSAYLELGIDKYYTKSNNRLEDIINDIKATLKGEIA